MREIFDIQPQEFEERALELYRYQFENNAVYGEFCRLLRRTPSHVNGLVDIPFLPVELFKNHEVKTGNWIPEFTYTSSTTTGGTPSQHFVKELSWYHSVYTVGFERIYGPLKDWTILALLPSYLEREGSSLVHMAEGMVRQSNDKRSGFYLYNHDDLFQTIDELKNEGKKTLLLGVTFGLLDFADGILRGQFASPTILFPELRIMETGGMKGRRKELIREEVHDHLRKAFPQSPIDSEYGMTELLSQAYLLDSGLFQCPPWMRVFTRDIADPLGTPEQSGARGAFQIIDLANIDSCAFLSISDQGRVFEDGTFEVYGRLDHSEIRGCNLMISI